MFARNRKILNDYHGYAELAAGAGLAHTLGLNNPMLDADSYKSSHARQYPPGTTHVHSYIESRGGAFDHVLFFGLQAYLRKVLANRVNVYQIAEAKAFWEAHGEPFDETLWLHVVEKHFGNLPVEIRALPEGIVVPVKTPLVTIVNTDPSCFWLPSFLETALLRAVWYPTTVATQSFAAKQALTRAFARTSDDPAGIAFKLHDFGARGASSQETAALGGMAHLVNFMGSDTVSGILAARTFYDEPMAGFSIPAAEHSTITSWGVAHETDAYRNMLRQFADSPLVAVVSDSYDIFNAVTNIWGTTLRQEVLDGKPTLVVRPDSGDPITTPIEVIKLLDAAFGHTVNSKGFRVLNPKVRVIQGDGIDLVALRRILFALELAGYAIDNLAFGMGGGLLQKVDRDTCKFAMKCSAAVVDGAWRDVFKAPIGQPDKASKKGLFSVVECQGEFHTLPQGTRIKSAFASDDLLQIVWKNGRSTVEHTFAEVRARADASPLLSNAAEPQSRIHGEAA